MWCLCIQENVHQYCCDNLVFRTAVSYSLAQMFPKQRELLTVSFSNSFFFMISLMSRYESTSSTLKFSQFDVRTERFWFADLLAMDNIYLLTICYHPRREQCYSTQPIAKIDYSEPMKGPPLILVARKTMRGSLWWIGSRHKRATSPSPTGRQMSYIHTYSALLGVVQTGLSPSPIFNMFNSVDQRNSDTTAQHEAR